MYYVSRKVGRKYGVIDTKDGVEEFYFLKELEEFYYRGIKIIGVDFISRKFTVNPVNIVGNKTSAVRNKLLRGSSTGYKGFDLKMEDDKVIALPLTEEFFKNIVNDMRKNRFILYVPDMVTHISDNFFSAYLNTFNSFGSGSDSMSFTIVLPDYLEEIGSSAFSDWRIYNMELPKYLGRIRGCSDSRCSLSIRLDNLVDNTFHVKYLEENSVTICCKKEGNKLYLPDIKWLDNKSVYKSNRFTNLSVYLGDNLTTLTNFIQPSYINFNINNNFGSVSKQIMNSATIVYFNDKFTIKDINLRSDSVDEFYPYGGCYLSTYIYVMSKKAYNFYKKFFNKDTINNSSMVGIITYESQEGLSWLQDNLEYCCQHHRKYFKTFLEDSDNGSWKILELK